MSLNASKLQSETIVGPSKYFFSKFSDTVTRCKTRQYKN